MINKNKKQIGSFVIDRKTMYIFKSWCKRCGYSMSEIVYRLVLFFICGEFTEILNSETYSKYKQQIDS